MDANEKKLEQINRAVNNAQGYKVKKSVPVFEMFVTLFSISVSILLFLFPNMFIIDADKPRHLYWLLLQIMPQYMWAFAFFIAGVSKAIGLLLDSNITRIAGLAMSMMIYISFSAAYVVGFPSIGFVTFICMTIFTIVSIPIVKYTNLKK